MTALELNPFGLIGAGVQAAISVYFIFRRFPFAAIVATSRPKVNFSFALGKRHHYPDLKRLPARFSIGFVGTADYKTAKASCEAIRKASTDSVSN